jgi:hypothetical protein
MKLSRLLNRSNRRWLLLGLFLAFTMILSALMLHPAHAAEKDTTKKVVEKAHDPKGETISLEGVWKFKTDPDDTGLTKNWQSANVSDKAWIDIKVPAYWEDQGITTSNKLWTMDDLKMPYSGFAWYRKTIEIPSSWSGQTVFLSLGKVDDLDWTYFNGELIGHVGSEAKNAETKERLYAIPPDKVKAGKPNLLAVRVNDFRGKGGIYAGPLTLTVGENPAEEESGYPIYDIMQTNADIHIKEGETVYGDAVAIMGSVRVEGKVNGDVVAVGGSVIAGPKAVITGDVVCIGGKLQIDPAAQIVGERVNVKAPLGGLVFSPKSEKSHAALSLFAVMLIIGLVLSVFIGIAMLILLLVASKKIGEFADYLTINPGPAFGFGFLGVLLIIPVGLVLLFSCIGIPFIPVYLVLLLLAWIAGWATTSLWLGEMISQRFSILQHSQIGKCFLGFLALVILHIIPYVGSFLAMVLVMGGFGAVLVVCFNRKKDRNPLPPEFRPYVSYTPPSAPAAQSPAPQAPAAPPAAPQAEPPVAPVTETPAELPHEEKPSVQEEGETSQDTPPSSSPAPETETQTPPENPETDRKDIQ